MFQNILQNATNVTSRHNFEIAWKKNPDSHHSHSDTESFLPSLYDREQQLMNISAFV